MAEKSLFIDWVKKYLPALTIKVVEKFNDEKRTPSYRHKTMLTPKFSVSGKWESLSINNRLVLASLVAMDSPLPLISRPSIAKATGDISKIGLELYLNEKQLKDLDTMIATNVPTQQIIQTLFADVPRVIGGVYERLEKMLLEGLSTGVTVADTDNVGTGVRIDYQFDPAKKKGVKATWDNTAKPLDDIQALLDVADAQGDVIVHAMTDRQTAIKLLRNDQVKGAFAFSSGFNGDKAIVPTLSEDNLKALFQSKFGIELEMVNRTVKSEIDGKITNIKPWKAGVITFLTDKNVGDLVYTTLAEENHPVDGVTYQKADNFILVSMFRQNKPSLREVTNAQAMVVPVINADTVYILDTNITTG